MGNHDEGRSIKWWYEVGFNEVYKYPIIFNEWIVISHEPPQYELNQLKQMVESLGDE